ncbi:potassium/sodium hyperpolarization-activated cyclic nucleotide-gated channel 1-like isoform X2 [Alosa sapidissima]|uniref:potassium/sodium hyperpolarization-activated cyclic nucleotide-gated channel 1-like isoform X2 n=1 Tax=Alosa sapidissima TaxID=34773 RepID=UPI001C096B0E|nr:potassium/sodium hyperpolarization-activated cyclic nucleotide-gated channel 1-like isoform X2 [Alosa sapidissima]
MTNVDSACFFSTRKIGVMDNSTKKEPRNRLSKLLLPETSKFTLYYYRSKDEILKEQKKTEDLNYFIIHPYSLFRRYWLWIMILMSSTNIVFVPMVASFFGKQIYIGWTVYNVFVDISFIVDLCLTFRMGYHHGSMEAILDLRKIRNHYLKTWFIPDLLAATPVDYCVLILSTTLGGVDPDESRHLLKITNVFSLLRLLRVFRLVRYVNNCLERLSVSMKSFLEVIYNIFGIYLICHWNACFQFMLATWLDYPPNSWVTLAGLVDKPISVQYTRAMFRSLCHMMTLNYGSGIPKGISEQWMMITSITVGSVLYALVLAKITSLQATFNTSQRAYEDRAVMQHVCGDLLRNAFGNADLLFLSKLLLVVEFESYQMGDVIIRPGITADYMYFIDKGTIMVEDAGVQHKLIDGDFFGEIALVKFSKHYIKVWNLSPSRLVCLSCQAYHTVLQDFPELQGKQLSRRSLAPQRGGRT